MTDPSIPSVLTPEHAVRLAHAVTRMVMHGSAADAAQVILLLGSSEYERGKVDAMRGAVIS